MIYRRVIARVAAHNLSCCPQTHCGIRHNLYTTPIHNIPRTPYYPTLHTPYRSIWTYITPFRRFFSQNCNSLSFRSHFCRLRVNHLRYLYHNTPARDLIHSDCPALYLSGVQGVQSVLDAARSAVPLLQHHLQYR
jgi:hypothetical protein